MLCASECSQMDEELYVYLVVLPFLECFLEAAKRKLCDEGGSTVKIKVKKFDVFVGLRLDSTFCGAVYGFDKRNVHSEETDEL